MKMTYNKIADSPELNYRHYPELKKLERDALRRVIFCQGLSAPEVYPGDTPYYGEEARWWYEGKDFWIEQEDGASLSDHRYFKDD